MALVDTENPGAGILVDTKTVGRAVGDTSSSAVFLTDLPKNFHGGDEALHFALGELFGQYGKIKKIELYMEKGILETENFKGEALVVYHKTKQTGSHDKGDPVYEACSELDGRVRVLGKRNWRIRCESAVWQKEGYDAKEKAKLTPCVEITNLWEYDPSLPMSWFIQMQEAIRTHASEHITNPFVKVEPSQGLAIVWCKGAQDAMKFASLMQKSYFLGRKVTAALCRKEKPAADNSQKLPTGELTMQLPAGMEVRSAPGVSMENLIAAGIIPVTAEIPGAAAQKLPRAPEPAPKAPEPEPEEPVVMGPELPPAPAGLAFTLREGCTVALKGLVSKPENNGRRGQVTGFLTDIQKYQVRLEDGRLVKVKAENLDAVEPEAPAEPKAKRPRKAATAEAKPAANEPAEDAEAAEAEAATALDDAQAAAAEMAAGNVRHGPEMPDPNVDGFTATVCVDPALLPKREEPEAEAAQVRKRESSRSRERRQEERLAAAKARLAADAGPRPSWVVSGPPVPAATAQAAAGGSASTAKREPEESREELMKMSISKLKELLKEYGKTARGCIEKRDFVDRLKPAPKA